MKAFPQWELRKDLTGIEFRTASNHDPPFVTTIDANAHDIFTPPGFLHQNNSNFHNIFLGPSLYGDIWSLLQKITNFSYSMVNEGKWYWSLKWKYLYDLDWQQKCLKIILDIILSHGRLVWINCLFFKVHSVDGGWGSRNQDGTWNGVVFFIILNSLTLLMP